MAACVCGGAREQATSRVEEEGGEGLEEEGRRETRSAASLSGARTSNWSSAAACDVLHLSVFVILFLVQILFLVSWIHRFIPSLFCNLNFVCHTSFVFERDTVKQVFLKFAEFPLNRTGFAQLCHLDIAVDIYTS